MTCALPLPSIGAILCRPVFDLSGRKHRKYRVVDVRKSRLEVKLQEIPSEANPNPKGPPFWASCSGDSEATLFVIDNSEAEQ